LLFGLGWLGTQIRVAAPQPQAPPSADATWRHTRHGWQQMTCWTPPPRVPPPALHPAVLGLLELLLGSALLVGLGPCRTANHSIPVDG
jgi:hypothetical protein